jgi:hypothetical protein
MACPYTLKERLFVCFRLPLATEHLFGHVTIVIVV